MSSRAARRGAALVAVVALVAGCLDGPTSPPTQGVAPTSAASTGPTEPLASIGPSPTAAAGVSFPLAVATGLTNLKATITLDELAELATKGRLLAPCGVRVDAPAMEITSPCVPADDIPGDIQSNPNAVAVLPPGLVERDGRLQVREARDDRQRKGDAGGRRGARPDARRRLGWSRGRSRCRRHALRGWRGGTVDAARDEGDDGD